MGQAGKERAGRDLKATSNRKKVSKETSFFLQWNKETREHQLELEGSRLERCKVRPLPTLNR